MSLDARSHSASSIKSFQYIDEEAAICGYLYKKTKDGRWQRRWFETNGVYLTYYKSRKVEKLLAALSLPQVGDIRAIEAESDPEGKGGLFELELKTRVYVLRAKSDEEAMIWVNALKQIRDQGMSLQENGNNVIQNNILFSQSQHNNNNPSTDIENSQNLSQISSSQQNESMSTQILNPSTVPKEQSSTRETSYTEKPTARWKKENVLLRYFKSCKLCW